MLLLILQIQNKDTEISYGDQALHNFQLLVSLNHPVITSPLQRLYLFQFHQPFRLNSGSLSNLRTILIPSLYSISLLLSLSKIFIAIVLFS